MASMRRAWAGAIAGIAGFGIAIVAVVLVVASALTGFLDGCSDIFDADVGPGKGDDSEELAVEVAPAEELADGTTVFVSSQAFRPHGIIGVAVCLEEAITEDAGVDACDSDAGQRFATTAEGDLAAVIAVPRVITVAGTPHDCAARPGRCLVVAADSSDFDLSGGQPVSFAPDLGPADLEPAGDRSRTARLPGAVTPDGPLPAGTTVAVEASGFMPGEPLLVGWCTNAFLQVEVWQACRPAGDDTAGAVGAIMGRSVDQVSLHADAEGAVRVDVAVEGSVAPGLSEGQGADCTTAPGACAVVVAAADTQRSAYLPITVTS